MVATAPTVAPLARAAPQPPPRSMVPSLSFLPRWWVIAQVLLGVVASLVVIAWLAVIASRGGKPVPAAGRSRSRTSAGALHLAAAAPGPALCPAGLPYRGCPPAALLLLGLHERCKAADSFLYEFHRAYLFTPTMCTRRPPGLPPGPHIATSIHASFGISSTPPDEDLAKASTAGDSGRPGGGDLATDGQAVVPPEPAPPAPAQRDAVRDIWDNLFVEDDGQPRARHTHVHHHYYDHYHHFHRHPLDEHAEAEHLVSEGRGHVLGHGHSHHIGPDGVPYTVYRAHDPLAATPAPTGPQRPRRAGRAPDTTTTMVCYLFITLLVASAILAIGEVIRDWWTHLAAKSRRG